MIRWPPICRSSLNRNFDNNAASVSVGGTSLPSSSWEAVAATRRRRQIRRVKEAQSGRTHLLIALGAAAAEQSQRVRSVTSADRVNELVEAAAEERALPRRGPRGRHDLF